MTSRTAPVSYTTRRGDGLLLDRGSLDLGLLANQNVDVARLGRSSIGESSCAVIPNLGNLDSTGSIRDLHDGNLSRRRLRRCGTTPSPSWRETPRHPQLVERESDAVGRLLPRPSCPHQPRPPRLSSRQRAMTPSPPSPELLAGSAPSGASMTTVTPSPASAVRRWAG